MNIYLVASILNSPNIQHFAPSHYQMDFIPSTLTYFFVIATKKYAKKV